jgi:predicted extracellular nuclease
MYKSLILSTLSIVLFVLITAVQCNKREEQSLRIAFYNVENLFDTINDPTTDDDDFLPNGKYQWNSARYSEKLINIAAVIDSMLPGPMAPHIIGLCEIENQAVLQDLILQENLKINDYGIIHYDSPDTRGIDVACLYNKKELTLVKSEAVPVILTGQTDFKTRDLLFCEFSPSGFSQHLYVYVNHWPSRRGGEEASSYKREAAAATLLTHAKNSISDFDNANILIIGDMNDYPTSRSTYEILGAKEPTLKSDFTNLMYSKHIEKMGTYYYNKEWGVIDNIIISQPLSSFTNEKQAVIFKKDWLLYTSKQGETMPSRSYTGTSYHKGGYSDHLPVYVDLTIK